MRLIRNIAIFCGGALIACSDYELNPKVEEIPVIEAPNIHVSPASLNFGHLDAGVGESKAQVITITNAGNKNLNLSHVALNATDLVYTITPPHITTLKPDQATRVTVTYIPRTYETNSNSVLINSNDPDEAVVTVPIRGESSAPVIEIDPMYYDFGTTYIGCEAKTVVGITNIGDSDLIISDIQYYVSYPPELSIEIDTATMGPFPWTLEPNERQLVTIYHEPWDIQEDSGFIEVHSSDPATPVAQSDQEAMGDYYAWATDFYEQEEIANADILFVIDNSCSMHSHQTNLSNNFSSFISVFANSGVDYQIAFITTDNENFVDGKIVRSTDADPIGDVTDIIGSIGISGHGLERGLWESYEATQSGGNAGPNSAFLRTDSRLVIVYLSDERDGSTTYSSMTPADYATHLLTLKTLSDQISVNAVAGDHPSGCSPPWAQHGAGYYEVVQQLGGTFMSICATDYGLQMDALARDSILLSAFELSEVPIEGSIIVTVNGYQSTDWTYNAAENAVYFDASAIPPTDAEIYIDYAVLAECPR
tara:strand:+ start:3394 stop:5001 length:1608 start_codon:yes stop_codon:yes gene_type:complete